MRQVLTITIDHEVAEKYGAYVRAKVEEVLRVELAKKKHKLKNIRGEKAWRIHASVDNVHPHLGIRS